MGTPDIGTDQSLTVASGQILLYRLFDVAQQVDLAAVERELRSARAAGEGVARLRLQRQRDGVVFTNPPVSAILSDRHITLGDRDWPVRVMAKVYDFGAMTIVWALSIPPGTTFEGLSDLSVELEGEQMRADLARWMAEDAALAVDAIRVGLDTPQIHESQETLTVYAIRGFVGVDPVKADVVAAQPTLPSLLLGERQEFSRQLREELLRSSYSTPRAILWLSATTRRSCTTPRARRTQRRCWSSRLRRCWSWRTTTVSSTIGSTECTVSCRAVAWLEAS